MLLALVFVVVALAGGDAAAAPKSLSVDDLLFELQLVPMDGKTPPAFTLERLADGKRVALAELRGRPALLYFWATW